MKAVDPVRPSRTAHFAQGRRTEGNDGREGIEELGNVDCLRIIWLAPVDRRGAARRERLCCLKKRS